MAAVYFDSMNGEFGEGEAHQIWRIPLYTRSLAKQACTLVVNGKCQALLYVENKAPAAFRIFWYYGPGRENITVVAVVPHP